MNGADGSNTADAVGGNGSSSIFFGLFSSDNSESEPAATSSSNNNNHQTNAARNANDKPDNNIPSNSTTNNCPYPPSFMEKRQKELSSYWTSLMKIEDIFEFSDVTSHRFGKVMASFLEVDRILLSRQTSSSSLSLGIHPNNQLHPQSASLSTRMNFPVIHENETFGYDAPVLHLSAVREMSGVIHHEDDVSILSDETGQARLLEASYTNGMNVIPPLNGNKVVDMVPHGYSNGVGGQGVVTSSAMAGGAVGSRGDVVVGITQSMERPYRSSSSSSITSSSAVSQSGRRRMGPRRPQTGAKPAFQRQFFLP